MTLYFNSVGVKLEDGSVGMGVDGMGVGEGPPVGGGPGVSATTVLTSAVMTIGVDRSLSGMIGAHPASNTPIKIVKLVIFFRSASLSEGISCRIECSLFYKKYRPSTLGKAEYSISCYSPEEMPGRARDWRPG
jgi:hypothetical protein